jgi:hypothetical protein
MSYSGTPEPDEETQDALWAAHDERTHHLDHASKLLSIVACLIDDGRPRAAKALNHIAKAKGQIDAYIEADCEECTAQTAGRSDAAILADLRAAYPEMQ